MTERKKMEEGLLYDANNDKDLVATRKRTFALVEEYNRLDPEDIEGKTALMKKILAKTGENFEILGNFHCDYGTRIEIGENFFANVNCTILDAGRVSFGDNVFIGPTCTFTTSGHPVDFERRNQGLEYARPIVVGDNVRIGANVVVIPGVTIGSGSVIGAGAVVTRDIPENSLAFGNPCRVYREISDQDRENLYELKKKDGNK